MDSAIDTLNISLAAKTFLKNLGFKMVSELSSHTYFTLSGLSSDYQTLLYVTHQLNRINLLIPENTDTHINTIPISSRLRNILRRNYVFYLCQLSEIPIEVIANFRGLGKMTVHELEEVCKTYSITLCSLKEKENCKP